MVRANFGEFRTNQFDAPNGTSLIKLTLLSDEGRRLSTKNPYVNVGGFFTYERSYYAGHPVLKQAGQEEFP